MAAAHVQHTTVGFFSGTPQTTANFGVAVTTGNLLVVIAAWSNPAISITSVTDTGGNTYTQATGSPWGGADSRIAIYYKENCAGGSSFNVTVAWGSSPSFGFVAAHEASGIATSASFDKATGQEQTTPGTGTDAITSGAQTTTADGEYIVGAVMDAGGGTPTYTAGTGYTLRVNPSDFWATESQIQTSAGSIAATFTQATNRSHITAMATFKVPAAGGAGIVPILMRQYRARTQ